MPTENHRHGYTVTLNYTPGAGFTVAISTATGEQQKSPSQIATLKHAFRLAHKTLADAGFTVEAGR